MKILEELTEKIVSKSSPPEYPIMQVLVEMSEHGIIGLNKDGTIIFNNLSASNLLKDKCEILKGKSVFDLVNSQSVETLKPFIFGMLEHNVTKIDLDSTKDGQIFDVIAYRVKNGEICFVLFLINCLENLMFRKELCPMRTNCPFNYKCQKYNPEEKIENNILV
jgi:nitrogen-specific signal transduction histidine kinase